MSEKKIAVLMSTYNGEKYIREQLDSILAQKCTYPINIYIRDDGSTDKTIDIINQYQERHKNISLIKGKNIGYNASFFTLLKSVSGYDFYAFSDQDDVWMPDKIQTAVNKLETDSFYGPKLYGSCSYLVHDDMIPFGTTQRQNKEITFYNTIIQNFLPGHSQVMNSELHKILNEDIDYSKLYVYDAWITNVAIVKGKVLFDDNPHTFYRMHEGNGLGFSESKIGWFTERINRIKKNQGGQYSKQIDYFLSLYGKDLKPELATEMLKYKNGKKNNLRRLKYIKNSKLYRQKKKETLLFKLMYIAKIY